jgi:hypothetical protein
MTDTEAGYEELLFFDSEPIIAYRVWGLSWLNGEPEALRSITYRIRWPKRKPMRAHCLFNIRSGKPSVHPSEDAPVIGHTCGIYAVKTVEQTETWRPAAYNRAELEKEIKIVGTVALWGRVLRHANGYRAEMAYPQEILSIETNPEDAEQLGHWLETTYGIPMGAAA